MVGRRNPGKTKKADSGSGRGKRNDRLEVWSRGAALFPQGIGGGDGVSYGYKGKGILIHSITDANGMPLVAITTPANGDERQQVLTMLAQIQLETGKRGNPKRRPKTLAADLSSSAKNKNLTVDIDPRY